MSVDTNEADMFERVYAEVFPLLIRVAFHMTGDMGAAEDLCQEAFIRYYNRITPLPDINQSKYWLIRVMKNLAYNRTKKKGRELKAYERAANEPVPEQPSAETDLIRSETARLVQDAVDTLPPKLKSVLVLKEYGNLSYKEIAKSLKITEGNVKVRMYRARAYLEKLLEKEDVDVSG
jgi:RNA polymerase sigma factor (sigma-70 family)